MAEIVNIRDTILQKAELRTIPVEPPKVVIIEGYTGITLSKDISLFMVNNNYPNDGKLVTPDRAVITATLKGIPATQEVLWTANVPLTDTVDPLVKLIEGKNLTVADLWTFPKVTASVTYGGRVFSDTIQISIFTG